MVAGKKQTVFICFLAHLADCIIEELAGFLCDHLAASVALDSTNVGNCCSNFNDSSISDSHFLRRSFRRRESDPCSIGGAIVLHPETVIEKGNFAMHSAHMFVISGKIILFSSSEGELPHFLKVDLEVIRPISFAIIVLLGTHHTE